MQSSIKILLAACAALSAAPASAENYTASVGTKPAPALGSVVRGNAVSTFVINASTGVVTSSGPAIRLSSVSVTSPQITIQCVPTTGSCSNKSRTITVSAGAVGGDPDITNFTITAPSGNISAYGGATSGFPLSIPLSFTSGNTTKTVTFKLGMTIRVPANASTGDKSLTFTVAP